MWTFAIAPRAVGRRIKSGEGERGEAAPGRMEVRMEIWRGPHLGFGDFLGLDGNFWRIASDAWVRFGFDIVRRLFRFGF